MSTKKHITLGDLNAKSDVRGGAAKSTGKGKNPVTTGGNAKGKGQPIKQVVDKDTQGLAFIEADAGE